MDFCVATRWSQPPKGPAMRPARRISSKKVSCVTSAASGSCFSTRQEVE
jgi:hypothetical protein